MYKLMLVALGGAVGSTLRYLIVSAVHAVVGGAFPLGTLLVNTLGCFTIGFLGSVMETSWGWRDAHRVAIVVGLLGGFTTFSAYAWDTLALAQHDQRGLALVNVFLENSFGLAAVWGGWVLANRFLPRAV